ncbi:MAG: PAC2 family protein [Candidatus Bathyarchaeia archaeon]
MKERLRLICRQKPTLKKPIAVSASPGLRSIGRIALDHIIRSTQSEMFAELYSPYFPVLYYSQPSYAADPNAPGEAGIIIEDSFPSLPAVRFYYLKEPEIVIIEGYHADFKGQYEAAEKALEFCNELDVQRIIVLAGYAQKGAQICCAAGMPEILEEVKSLGLGPGYEGPFYGFSGLLFGLSRAYNLQSLALFSQTKPAPDNPEEPDVEAAESLLTVVNSLLGLSLPPLTADEIDASRAG